MSQGGKGGQQTSSSTVKLPKEIEDQAKANIGIANEVAAIGYTPYQGNTVAAFTPNQQAAMQNNAHSMNAFNMGGPGAQAKQAGVNPMTGMKMNATNQGGVMGYSPMGQYNAAVNAIPDAQRAMIESFTMNPRTGAGPTNPTVPGIKFQYGQGQGGGQGGGQRRANSPSSKGAGNGILGDGLQAKANYQRGR